MFKGLLAILYKCKLLKKVTQEGPYNPISNSQITRIIEILSITLPDSGLLSKSTRLVLDVDRRRWALQEELFTVVRRHIEAVSDIFVRKVYPHYKLAPQEAINATGRRQSVDNDIVSTMPKGVVEGRVEVVFFKVNHYVCWSNVDQEFELRDLKPADPYSLLKVNEDDPSFADTLPNFTYWKDAKNRWCFLKFGTYDGVRYVTIDHFSRGWCRNEWLFAGVRK